MADTSTVQLVQASAFDWMRNQHAVNPESVDLIITDPPYWSLDKHRKMGTTTRLGGGYHVDARDESKWFDTIDESQLITALCYLISILKNNSYMYMMCDFTVLPVVLNWANDTSNQKSMGITYVKPLIWDKVNIGMGYHWRARHEYIVLIKKGKRRLNDLSKSDILTHKFLKGKKYYPTEKPVPLFEEIIANSSNSGELVLDCFAGSGAVGQAALNLGRNALLIDHSFTAITHMESRFEIEAVQWSDDKDDNDDNEAKSDATVEPVIRMNLPFDPTSLKKPRFPSYKSSTGNDKNDKSSHSDI